MFGKFGWIDILEPVTLRQKQLLGTSFGFPGGFAWALLASKEALGSVWLPLEFAAFSMGIQATLPGIRLY